MTLSNTGWSHRDPSEPGAAIHKLPSLFGWRHSSCYPTDDQTGAELHAVYVIGDYFEQISVMFPEGGRAALSRFRNYVQERMAKLRGEEGVKAITHISEGRPYEEIVRLAAEKDADLIVIGTNVHASLFGGGAPVLGAEIERVVRNAPCPVLCVPATRAVTPLPAFVAQPVPL